MSNIRASASTHVFQSLKEQPADALLALIGLYREDPRPDKLDLGVGVYREEDGSTPVLKAMKAAEKILHDTQDSKSYLGPEGDTGFVNRIAPLVFGEALAGSDRLTGVQTPGGTGALRLAADLVARLEPRPSIWVGTPTWPNHEPIFSASGLKIERYRYFDVPTQTVLFDEMRTALSGARPGDVVLLHGCCHNPTGADLSADQWREVASLLRERSLLPFIDLAYQGLGGGMEQDAAGLRTVLDVVPQALIAYSCDKNFGLYRERTGALFAVAETAETVKLVRGNLLALARSNWSMPPDHGAAAVRIILEDADLTRVWREELSAMQARVAGVRAALAAADERLQPLGHQKGMFSVLPISPEAVASLRKDHGIYMAGSGRINIAGLTRASVEQFVAALRRHLP